MKIVFISEYFYPRKAGGEVWSWELCKELAARGHDVSVLALRHKKDLKKEEMKDGVRILRPTRTTERVGNRIGRWLATKLFLPQAKRIIQEIDPDVIHVNAYALNVPVSRFAQKQGIRCITSVHSYFGDAWEHVAPDPRILRWLERRNILNDCSDAMIVPSAYTQKKILEDTGRETKIVHHWCPEEFPGSKKHDKTLVFVGSLESVKDPLACIPVAADLGCSLLVIGRGSLADEMRKKAAQNGVEIQIILDTSRDDVLSHIAGASMVLIPSHSESFSLVALEAVAQGTPVAGREVGIIPDLPHISWPPGEIPKRLSKGEQAVVRKRFEKENTINQYMGLYQSTRR